MGIARYKNRQCCAAVVAEVAVDEDTAEVRATRLWIAADAGQVIDPDGCATSSRAVPCRRCPGVSGRPSSSTPRARWRAAAGRTTRSCGFDEAPSVETVLLDRTELPSLGAGEATVGPASGALANAVFAATGLRVRDLPLTPDGLRQVAAGYRIDATDAREEPPGASCSPTRRRRSATRTTSSPRKTWPPGPGSWRTPSCAARRSRTG